MVTAGIDDHPAAQFCVNLSIGGFTDWYLPSRYELDIAYFNLKPTTQQTTQVGAQTYTLFRNATAIGTAAYPIQTTLTAFNTSAEAFVADDHWSSTEHTATYMWRFIFTSGNQSSTSRKTTSFPVRAFRRIAL
jgi:hypothetical protein